MQLFRELSNPASDLSWAAGPNRIVALTPRTMPPAVAEPSVGRQQKCAGSGGGAEGGGGCLTQEDSVSI